MSVAQAATYVDATRVIINENSRESTPQVTNAGTTPVLFQFWIDRGDARVAPEQLDVPFFLDKSIFRVEPGYAARARILSDDGQSKLPRDRESLFWLNVLEVPATPVLQRPSNRVQVAFQTRIKLFYRPVALEDGFDESVNRLRFALHCTGSSTALVVHNPTAFHHTLLNVRLLQGERVVAEAPVEQDGLLPPGGQQSVRFAKQLLTDARATRDVQWDYINDYGAAVEAQGTIAISDCD